METERLRTFIAVDLPEASRRALLALQDGLKAGSRTNVKWVDPASIHLTLKFLGGTDTGLVPPILTVMAGAVRDVKPFAVELQGLGAFPNLNRVRVVWVGLGGEVEKLGLVQQRIEAGLVPLGFAAEDRPFSPHFTLGRVREQALPEERRRLGELIATTAFEGGGRFSVDAVHLMKSQLTRAGAIYTRLGSVELGKR
jgi:RNA 2',3'-cyclic 3'-phosphodiesterase